MGEKSTAPEGKKASSSRWRILWEVKARHEKYVTWRTLSRAKRFGRTSEKSQAKCHNELDQIGVAFSLHGSSNLLPRFIFVLHVLWNVNVGIYWSAWLSRKFRCDRRVVTECSLWFGKVRSLFSGDSGGIFSALLRIEKIPLPIFHFSWGTDKASSLSILFAHLRN